MHHHYILALSLDCERKSYDKSVVWLSDVEIRSKQGTMVRRPSNAPQSQHNFSKNFQMGPIDMSLAVKSFTSGSYAHAEVIFDAQPTTSPGAKLTREEQGRT